MRLRIPQWPLLLVLAGVLLLTPSVRAQDCTNGLDWDNTPNPADIIPFDWSRDFVALTRLVSHYMPTYGDGDSMTEPFEFRRGQMGTHPFGSDGPHDTWYLARDAGATTDLFYRLLGGTDHMDSHDPNEASSIGYHMEFPLGRPWTVPTSGMQPITRYFNPTNFDHRTWLPNETPPGYAFDRNWSAASGTPRYGYPRYGNKPRWCEVNEAVYTAGSPILSKIENTKWRVEFNPVWGNAIGRIYWKGNGTPWLQLVRDDIGSMVQSTIFNTAPKWDENHQLVPDACCDYNPTQSGGIDIWNGPNTRRWAGSPVIRTYKTSTMHETELKPFNFPFNVWSGTDQWSPLMWKGTFQRTTTVGLRIEGTSTTYPDVMLMSFDAKRDDGNVRPGGHNLNNTHWLTMNPLGNGNFSGGGFLIERVRLDTGATESVLLPDRRFDRTVIANQSGNTRSLLMDGRAVMLSKNDGSFAIGFHHTATAPISEGPTYDVMFWCSGAPVSGYDCPFPNQTVVFNTFTTHTLGTAYDLSKRQNTYMVIGTRSTVIRRLRQIECNRNGGGATCLSIP